MGALLNIPQEDLKQLYWDDEMSTLQIAEVFGCSKQCILNYMIKYDIPRRTRSEAQKRKKNVSKVGLLSKDDLHDLYWNRDMSTLQIAEVFGCGKRCILDHMIKYDVPRRTRSEAQTLKFVASREELIELYWDKRMPLPSIADLFDCNPSTIRERLIKFGIDRRPVGSQTLDKSSNWQGGISFEPYCPKFNEAFKESIREKFGRTCFLCPTTEQSQMEDMSSQGNRAFRLAVHHVNYNKDCLCDDTVCEFVPLCLKCHGKINYDREYWEEIIMEKLEMMKCT